LCGGNAAINVAGQATYEREVAPFATELCPCPATFPPACSNHKCVPCTGGPSDPPECGNSAIGFDGGLTCQQGLTTGSGSTDGGACTFSTSESCNNGTTYSVTCTCPDSTCSCSQMGMNNSGSGGGAPFAGCGLACGSTSAQLAFQACGFPPP
jgi:hypothetical protein